MRFTARSLSLTNLRSTSAYRSWSLRRRWSMSRPRWRRSASNAKRYCRSGSELRRSGAAGCNAQALGSITRSPLRPPAVTASDMVLEQPQDSASRWLSALLRRLKPRWLPELRADRGSVDEEPASRTPAGIVTEFAVSDAAALLLLIWNIWSVAEGAAMVTVAKVLLIPLTEAGLSAMDAGWPCGVIVSGD